MVLDVFDVHDVEHAADERLSTCVVDVLDAQDYRRVQGLAFAAASVTTTVAAASFRPSAFDFGAPPPGRPGGPPWAAAAWS